MQGKGLDKNTHDTANIQLKQAPIQRAVDNDKLESEKSAILSGQSFSAIADVIEGSEAAHKSE